MSETPLPHGLDDDVVARMSDASIRKLIRFGLTAELRRRSEGGVEGESTRERATLAALATSPIAVHADAANEQHYELPPGFFRALLGPRMKYSACLFPPGTEELDAAEAHTLHVLCERAGITDGQEVLELGCGWGALTLWIAERYPGVRVLAISNSRAQVETVATRAAELGLRDRVTVELGEISRWRTERRFDRVVSIEMFEHLRNHGALLERIAGWMRPGGRLLVQMFTHRRLLYLADEGFIAERFFTGGLVPSSEYLLRFQDHLRLVDHQRIDGRHYQRTCEAWLDRLDARRSEALDALRSRFGPDAAARRLAAFRLFLLVCAEATGFARGSEWIVSHYLFEQRPGHALESDARSP